MKFFKVFFFLITVSLFANNDNLKQINWISFEKAIELNKSNPKPIIIDIYTDWCHWCKVMDKKTYDKEAIVNLINDHFYAVKLDAEQKEDITFNDHIYKYIPSGSRGVHELAASLLNGKLSYPSTVFLDKELKLIQAIPGYIKAPAMEKFSHYLGKEIYLEKEWTVFEKEFKSNL